MKRLLSGLLLGLFVSMPAFAIPISVPVMDVLIDTYEYQYNTPMGTTYCKGEVRQIIYSYGPPTVYRWEICVG